MNATTSGDVVTVPAESAGPIAFGCPACGQPLRVSAARRHESGPCPYCAVEISMPGARDEKRRRLGVAGGARSFVAHKVILPTAADALDDSWRHRHENDLRAWRRRRKLEKQVAGFFESRTWRRIRLCGSVVLLALLGVALAFVYAEKKMSARNQGMFDGINKAEDPF